MFSLKFSSFQSHDYSKNSSYLINKSDVGTVEYQTETMRRGVIKTRSHMPRN